MRLSLLLVITTTMLMTSVHSLASQVFCTAAKKHTTTTARCASPYVRSMPIPSRRISTTRVASAAASTSDNTVSSTSGSSGASIGKTSTDETNSNVKKLPYRRDRFSVAPMMDYTDRHQRYLHRLLSRQSVMYTEMVTAYALAFSPPEQLPRFLEFQSDIEEPVVLQLGGSDPTLLKKATQIACSFGYQEINLNVGCPSDKVADNGCFGAALMYKPQLVAELMSTIQEEMAKSVKPQPNRHLSTVKCRIGVDDFDSYEYLTTFIDTIHRISGVTHFIIHARKAILGGKLTPDQNRKIPTLKYDVVYRLVEDFPHLQFTINGGINTYEECLQHLANDKVHGVMIGRAIVNYPFYWRNIDSLIYNESDPQLSRREILDQYVKYAVQQEEKHGYPRLRRALIKPLWNLFHGEPKGKQFRVQLETNLRNPKYQVIGGIQDVVWKATECLRDDTLDSRDDVVLQSIGDREDQDVLRVPRSKSPSKGVIDNKAVYDDLDRQYQLIGHK